jgi:hypothetical protein
MNKIKKMLCAACTLVLISVSNVANADSSNFAGPYVGLQVLGLGAEFAGTSNSSAGTSAAIADKATAGAAATTWGLEGGYTIPLGTSLALDIGAQYLEGKGTVSGTNDQTDRASHVKFTFDKHFTYYIAPTVALTDTSSIYLKMGVSEADTDVTGDVTTPGTLSGEMYALGTRTVLESGIFIRTEAGFTSYNGISAHGKGEGTAGTTLIDSGTSYSAEPTIVHGTVSLGFRF